VRVAHLIRKPLSEGSVGRNVLIHGTGGINIDAIRIGIGRFPSNLILIGSSPIVSLDEQSLKLNIHPAGNVGLSKIPRAGYEGGWGAVEKNPNYYGDEGGASRFFKQVRANDAD